MKGLAPVLGAASVLAAAGGYLPAPSFASQTVQAALTSPGKATLLSMTSTSSAHASGAVHSRCGGFVRLMAEADVEVSARGNRIEVRIHAKDDAPLRARGSVALLVHGQPTRVELVETAPGLLTAALDSAPTGDDVILHLAFAGGVVGAARFPLRPSTCPDG